MNPLTEEEKQGLQFLLRTTFPGRKYFILIEDNTSTLVASNARRDIALEWADGAIKELQAQLSATPSPTESTSASVETEQTASDPKLQSPPSVG